VAITVDGDLFLRGKTTEGEMNMSLDFTDIQDRIHDYSLDEDVRCPACNSGDDIMIWAATRIAFQAKGDNNGRHSDDTRFYTYSCGCGYETKNKEDFVLHRSIQQIAQSFVNGQYEPSSMLPSLNINSKPTILLNELLIYINYLKELNLRSQEQIENQKRMLVNYGLNKKQDD
jgi:hypothetical protein